MSFLEQGYFGFSSVRSTLGRVVASSTEERGSNPTKFFVEYICLEKMSIRENSPSMAHLIKKVFSSWVISW